ncbi:MAG: SIR2 family protein [Anaerolineales bacterium]|nr:SIR2 family protein [Anaerolineales bacterium]
MAVTINLRNLRILLGERFNDDDLRTLCFDLGVEYDDLSGENKGAKLRSLLTHLNTRSRFDDLFEILKQDRPGVYKQLTEMLESEEQQDTKEEADDSHGEPDSLHGRFLARISQSLKRGRLLLFLGADLHPSVTGLPDRQTLADALAREEGIEPGKPLTAVAQQVMHANNRFVFTRFIREQLDMTGISSQAYHRLLTGIIRGNRMDMVITTAYDGLLELAFRQADLPLHVVVNDTDLSFMSADQPTLIKLFGDWQQPASLVVTEQDQSMLLNGRFPNKAAVIDTVRLALKTHAAIFIGINLRDTAITVLFDSITGSQFQQPAFAVWSGMDVQEAEAWRSNRNLTIIDDHPAAFLQALLNS